MNPLEILLGRTTWATAIAEEGERVSDIEDEDDLVTNFSESSFLSIVLGGAAQSVQNMAAALQ